MQAQSLLADVVMVSFPDSKWQERFSLLGLVLGLQAQDLRLKRTAAIEMNLACKI
jgi:ABC-type Fe3+-hydroxamate transport system substrate-binding protein